jgi:cullin 1
LNEERNRVADYLNQSSETKLLKVVEEEILEKVETLLLEKEASGCRVLFAQPTSRRICRECSVLFSRLENGLNPGGSHRRELFVFLAWEWMSSTVDRQD